MEILVKMRLQELLRGWLFSLNECGTTMKNKNKKQKKDKIADQVTLSAESTESAESSVARVTEIIASSPNSFEDAVAVGVARACKTLQNVTGAWVQDQKVEIENGQIKSYRVNLKVTFILND